MFRSPAFFHCTTITQQSIIILQSIEYIKWTYLWNLIYTSYLQHYNEAQLYLPPDLQPVKRSEGLFALAPKQNNWSLSSSFEVKVLHLAFSYQVHCREWGKESSVVSVEKLHKSFMALVHILILAVVSKYIFH